MTILTVFLFFLLFLIPLSGIFKKPEWLIYIVAILSQIRPVMYPVIIKFGNFDFRLDDLVISIFFCMIVKNIKLIKTRIPKLIFYSVICFLLIQSLCVIISIIKYFPPVNLLVEQIRSLLKTGECVCLFFAIILFIDTEKKIGTLLNTLRFWLILQGIYIILQRFMPAFTGLAKIFTGTSDLTQIGFVGDKNIAGLIMLIAIWLCLSSETVTWKKILEISLYLIVIVISFSKTIYIGLTLTTMFYLIFSTKKNFLNVIVFLSLTIVLVIGIICLLPSNISMYFYDSIDEIVSLYDFIIKGDMNNKMSSAYVHMIEYKLIDAALYYSPFWGTGPGTTNDFWFYLPNAYNALNLENIPEYMKINFFGGRTQNWGSDNQYIATIVETGLVGFFSFILLWFSFFKISLKNICIPSLCLSMIIISVLVSFAGRTNLNYNGNSIPIFIWICLAIIVLRCHCVNKHLNVNHGS